MVQQLMDTTVISSTFPEISKELISRENYIESIEELFEDGNKVVLTQGSEIIGKTTLLYQFCRRHPDNVISFFIKSSRNYTNDLKVILYDLSNQINWIINGKELDGVTVFDETLFNALIYDLLTYSRKNKKKFYFVIDGLNNLTEKENHVVKFILERLPINLQGFKFLMSYDEKELKKFLGRNAGINIKTFTLSGFTIEQTKKFFEGTQLESHQNDLEEIRKVCKGNPGHLESIKRIVSQQDVKIEEFIDDLPSKLPELFMYEWKQADLTNQKIKDFISVLAFDNNFYTITEIADIIDINYQDLKEIIEETKFLELNHNTDQVFFVTNAFKNFAGNELLDNKKRATDMLLEYLLKDASNISKIVSVPDYLYNNKRLPEILGVLTPDNLRALLKKSQSISSMKKITEFGLNASLHLNYNEDFIKFSIQNSALDENYSSKIYQSEVQALLELNDFDKAMMIAQNNQLIEDRLQMLSIIARHQKESNEKVAPELLSHIEALSTRIDFKQLGERSIDIAKDIVYFNSELAIKIIEDSTGVEKGENALDHAYASLSIEALGNADKNSMGFEGVEKISSKIKSPGVRNIFKDFSLFLKNYSEIEILNEIKDLESTTDQLYILSNWAERTEATKDDYEVENVIKFAFDKAIATTEYAPNAGVYRKLSNLILTVKNVDIKRELIDLFDSQMENIKEAGPMDDYVQLNINLTKAQYSNEQNLSAERLTELYFYLSEPIHSTVYKDGFAIILDAITHLDPYLQNSDMKDLYELSKDELDQVIMQIITGTANHFEEMKGIIKGISKCMPMKAIEIIEKVNTKNNREQLYLYLIDSLCENKIELKNNDILKISLREISDADYFDEAIFRIIDGLFETYEMKTLEEDFHVLVREVFKINHSHMKCVSLCKAYILTSTNMNLHSLSESLLLELNKVWNDVDVAWYKVDIGFQIIKLLAKEHISVAKEYLKLTNEFREETSLYDPNISAAFITSIKLINRAYSGLLPTKLDEESDFERIARLISAIPSKGEQAILWANLAIRNYDADNIKEGSRIVSTYLRTCVDSISDNDSRYKRFVIINVAPALYLFHRNTTLDLIRTLDTSFQDSAYYYIARFILTKCLPTEPYDEILGENAKISYEEITDLCELMFLMESDAIIYNTIHEIMEILNNKKNETNYTTQQTSDIYRRIEKVISEKLPAHNHIEHDGYKLISLMELYRAKKQDHSKWLELIEQTEEIPNASDRLFIYTILISYLPRGLNDKATKLFDSIDSIIEDIPSMLERIARYKFMGSHFIKIDPPKSKRFIKKAMELSIDKSGDDTYSIQKELIELAHKINPEFAESLVSITDKDPARKRIKREVKSELKTLELKEKMLKDEKLDEELSENEKIDYAKASWKLLGSLNANRITTVHFEQTKQYIEVGSKMPLSLAYPIFSWVIENANKRVSKTGKNEVNTIIRPLFESTLLGAELFLIMADNNKENLRVVDAYKSFDESDSLIVKPGEREKGIKYILEWAKELKSPAVIKICDPYFGLEDLDIIYTLWEIDSNFEFEILTSKKQQKQNGLFDDIPERFSEYWRLNVSNQTPPKTRVVIVGVKDGSSPIHDRWILGPENGIRLGTSLNSLGRTKETEISIMKESQFGPKLESINRYLYTQESEHNGERIKYETFFL